MSCCPCNQYFPSSCAPTGTDDSLACCFHYVVKICTQFPLPGHIKFVKIMLCIAFTSIIPSTLNLIIRLSRMETRRQRFPWEFWKDSRTNPMEDMLLLLGGYHIECHATFSCEMTFVMSVTGSFLLCLPPQKVWMNILVNLPWAIKFSVCL